MHIKDYILNKKYGAGCSDWDKLEEIINDFEIDDDSVDKMIEENDHINGMIRHCFYNVVLRLETSFPKLKRLEVNNVNWYSMFTNCIDSHLSIFDEEVYSYKEAREAVKEHFNDVDLD